MKVRISAALLLLLVSICFIGLDRARAASREPEEIWQELLKLPADERQKRLVAGAKAEGKAILYGNISADHLEWLRVDFAKRYGVKLDGYRASGERVANRLLTEARAGKLDADVMAPSNEHIPALIKAGVAGRYNSPERAAYPDSNKDKQGYWTAYDYNVAVIAYNTQLVPATEAPKKYDDFLEPKWKGNFALDMDPDKSIMGWFKTWGPERTKQYMQAISKNEVVVRKGHTLLSQLLCAGEFKATIDLYAYRLADLKHTRGCPVEISYPDPTPATPSPVGVIKKTPRPCAAALLLDYILSEPAQKIFSAGGRISARRGVRPRYPELDLEAKGVKILLLTPDDAVR
ncbi:MAG TPA: extracellular solute-binding protein, partial [Candidatus Binatia bacterium]